MPMPCHFHQCCSVIYFQLKKCEAPDLFFGFFFFSKTVAIEHLICLLVSGIDLLKHNCLSQCLIYGNVPAVTGIIAFNEVLGWLFGEPFRGQHFIGKLRYFCALQFAVTDMSIWSFVCLPHHFDFSESWDFLTCQPPSPKTRYPL